MICLLDRPRGLTLDSSGNLYVADSSNNRIEEFNSSGGFVQTIGSLGSGNGQLNNPFGVRLDGSGALYVADYGNDRIVKFRAAAATPAPSSVLVLALGAVPLVGILRRRRR